MTINRGSDVKSRRVFLNFADEIFADTIHIVFENCRYGENGSGVRDGPSSDELADLFLLGRGGIRFDKINLVAGE